MDILTQLQTSLDELLAQYYASLHYINQHHSSSAVPGTNNPFGQSSNPNAASTLGGPSLTSAGATAIPTSPPPPPPPPPNQTQEHQPDPSLPPNHRPESPNTFHAAQRELAHDLILKYQQIQLLIRNLPGVERSEVNQAVRLKELDEELRSALTEREKVENERRVVLKTVESVLVTVRR